MNKDSDQPLSIVVRAPLVENQRTEQLQQQISHISLSAINMQPSQKISKHLNIETEKQIRKSDMQYKSDRYNRTGFVNKQFLNGAFSTDARKINKRIYILYTSGCVGANQKLQIYKDYLKQKMMLNSYLCDYNLTHQNPSSSTLISPILQNGFRVQYDIECMPNIKASINSTIEDVVKIAKNIEEAYQKYDAFIVIAGFDVMCYISTLLSFMLENLSKCVIFTGGHFPISYNRNDFVNNIIQSFTIISLSRGLNDVMIVCKNKGYRANRCIKVKQNQMDTIKSPNMHSLASIDIRIKFKFHLFLPIPTDQFSVFCNVSQKVHVLRFHLYINKETLKYDLKNPNIAGYVIEGYTAANLPESDQLLTIFKQVSQNDGKIFVNISQNIYKQKNSIMKEYLQKYHVYFGGDITVQAALAKLSFLIGKGYSKQQIIQKISMNMRGQMTEIKSENQFQIEAQGFMQVIEQVLEDYYPTATQKLFMNVLEDQIGNCITSQTTPEQFNIIYKYSDHKIYSQSEYLTEIIDRNFLLHHAVFHENILLIQYFLTLPVDRDALDDNQCSAYFYAIKSFNKSIIQFLYKKNCHVICPIDLLIDFFTEQLKKDNIDFFEMLYHIQFKTSLSEVVNNQKRSLAHLAAILGSQRCLDLFITKFKFQYAQRDLYGSSVQDYMLANKKKYQGKNLTNSLNSTKSTS